MGFVAIDPVPLSNPSLSGLFVSIALIYLLAHLAILDATEFEMSPSRRSLIALIFPFLITFFGVVLLAALQVVGL